MTEPRPTPARSTPARSTPARSTPARSNPALSTRLLSSQRMQRVDSPIIPTIAALVRETAGTISLGQGVVNYGPPAQALEAIATMTGDPFNHKYQAVTGYAPLVNALREKLANENGLRDSSQQIMVTAGSNMAFLNAVLAVGDVGDEFILPLPFYFNQEMAIRMAGCVPVPVPSNADFQLDLTAIEAAITPRTRAIITVSPSNPTGAVYHRDDLIAVNALCKARGLYHFSDEAYEYFVYDGAEHFSPGSIDGSGEHTLSFYSFSKNYGMASWRVGYVAYPNHLFDAMNKVQDTNLICAPMVSQVVALAALKLGRATLTPHLQSLAQVRQQVYRSLQPIAHLAQFPQTRGAFYVLLKLPGVPDALAFNQQMTRKHKVATIPGFAFGLTDTAHSNYQRLSFGALDALSVEQGVQRFVTAVKDWYDA